MSNFNAFRDNYAPGFGGCEGQGEKTFLFYLQGEPAIEHYTEEGATEELRDMTVRELESKGFISLG